MTWIQARKLLHGYSGDGSFNGSSSTPPLGQTVDTLSFAAWLKKEGDHVQQGEALYVVETDKAMLDVESPATGILAQVTAKSLSVRWTRFSERLSFEASRRIRT